MFFFHDATTTEIYTLTINNALPIYGFEIEEADPAVKRLQRLLETRLDDQAILPHRADLTRSEEHTSELQSQSNLVCRLLLEKTKNEVITFMVRMHISISSLQSHTVN